jgi:F-type H+-transporting ATPase subunit b
LKFKLKWIAAPILSLTLLAAFAASATAQEPAATQPASSQSVPAQAQATSAGEAKPKQQSDEEKFLHTKLVESIGKAMGLRVETTATLFLWLNFAIIFFAIVIPLVRILPKTFRKRRETLSRNLEEARKTTADANSRLSAVEAQLSKLDEEIAKIRAQVEEEIKGDEARIKSSISEESARVVAAAEQEIAMAAAQAQRSLKAFAADLAIDQAVKQLTLTAENDRALIEEFVAQAESGSSPGGKN